MILLEDLQRYLSELLPSSGLTDYCLNGLQVQGASEITRFATAVTASLATIQAAVDGGVQALIVHHGLFWNGDSYAITDRKRDKIKKLLDKEISLFAYHLPLDLHQQFGNNWKAARDLGWTELQPFGKYNNIPIGVKGKLPAMPREEFRQRLELYYQHPAYCALGGKEIIQTSALISGGAHKSIQEASSEKIDCFITGSFDEPIWHQAFEEQINFFALGHSATERVGPQAIGKHLQQHFNLEYQFIDLPNPF